MSGPFNYASPGERRNQSRPGWDDAPRRVQRRRIKGWEMPPNTVCVDRSTNWGNPYPAKGNTVDSVLLVALYRDWFKSDDRRAVMMRGRLHELRGKNLACWCKPGQPCHADVLLEMANS